jgi:hypothetical protein
MEKFISRPVLVDLGQAFIPAIGVISAIDTTKGTATVVFSDLSVQTHVLSAVALLKDKHTLYQQLLTQSANIASEDFKTLLKVNMLQENPADSSTLQAMQLLRHHPSALALASEPIAKVLGIELQPREVNPGR